jgi:hypothetical protein
LQLVEFNDRFNELNSQLLTQIAAFCPKNSFEAFKFESLMELAKSYPDDFNSTQLRDLGRDLNIYIVVTLTFILTMCELMKDLPI